MIDAGGAPSGALPDVVYVVRPGVVNEELQYSLRSLAINGGPHGKVWIVGTVPRWVAGVVKLPLDPHPEKFANQRQSLEAVVNHPDLSDRFILFNDDFFMVEPVGDWPVFHRGLMREYLANCGYTSEWTKAIGAAAKWMESRGHADVIAYEVHVPLIFDKAKFAELLAEYPKDLPFAAGELYAEAGVGGEGVAVGDSKVPTRDRERLAKTLARPMPYLSTNDDSFAFGEVGKFIKRMFPYPGPYEIPGAMMNVYDVVIGGVKHRLQLDDAGARMRGIVPYSERVARGLESAPEVEAVVEPEPVADGSAEVPVVDADEPAPVEEETVTGDSGDAPVVKRAPRRRNKARKPADKQSE